MKGIFLTPKADLNLNTEEEYLYTRARNCTWFIIKANI